MEPVTPVVEGLESGEIQIAKDQAQYRTLPSLVLRNGIFLSRWRLTEDERVAVANGSDIFLAVFSCTRHPPIMLDAILDNEAQIDHVRSLSVYQPEHPE